MTGSRLSHALETGQAVLPPGPVAVFRPPAGADLGNLGPDRCTVITGFRPDFEHWQARGYDCLPEAGGGSYAAAVVFVPRTRAFARAILAEALHAAGGPVIVDGQKTDGIESLLKAARNAGLQVGAPVSMRHGKLAEISGRPPADWHASEAVIEGGWITLPGVFSADAVDPASALLADALPPGLGGRVADLGAGWGYISARLLQRAPGVVECHLIEAEFAALTAARRNISDARARFCWEDAGRFADADGFDHVVTNPPFHAGRRPDPALGLAFIAAAARLLRPKGSLWLVANRHLPYEEALKVRYAAVTELAGTPAFKLLRADRPGPGRG